jgi:DNA-nicking Smr family endonuclease
MLALNYLFLGRFDAARAFMLNGGFIHQCAQKPIDDILVLCQQGSAPLCDTVVCNELPYYQSAFASSHMREHMEKYLMNVLPPDFVRRMSFAAHCGHDSGGTTWVNDYVSVIDNDWISSPHRSKRVLKGLDQSCIQITMLRTETGHSTAMSIRVSHTLKTLFIKYSQDQNVSLRSLRFSFDGKTLFLSSASKKTPEQLGIRNHDVIRVSSASSSSMSQKDQETTTTTQKDYAPSKKVDKKRKRKCKRIKSMISSKAVAIDNAQCHKLKHSQFLSKLFEEVEPRFRAIRQRLNTLALERTSPKEKSPKLTSTPPAEEAVYSANVGGKAGRSSYVIQVGEVNNLYKSSKKTNRIVPKFHMIDLHGYTRLEALDKLNESLPQWEKHAMEGSYPFVAPVVIICGGGNQVISETVSKWIKQNKVSNAPKNLFARAA